jgi:hypothetical protein
VNKLDGETLRATRGSQVGGGRKIETSTWNDLRREN